MTQNTFLVHGNWGDWGHWLGCSKSCGHGRHQRRRECNNPAPYNGGNECNGSNIDEKTCHEQDCPNCPSGWIFYGRNKKCYLLSQTKKTWEDALKFCKYIAKNNEGNLASIMDISQNEILRDMCKEYQCHIGGKRIPTGSGSHRWIWTDGTPWRFENWNTGEPNNHQGEEHFLGIYQRGGKWNDNSNKYTAHFLCQQEIIGIRNEYHLNVKNNFMYCRMKKRHIMLKDWI